MLRSLIALALLASFAMPLAASARDYTSMSTYEKRKEAFDRRVGKAMMSPTDMQQQIDRQQTAAEDTAKAADHARQARRAAQLDAIRKMMAAQKSVSPKI